MNTTWPCSSDAARAASKCRATTFGGLRVRNARSASATCGTHARGTRCARLSITLRFIRARTMDAWVRSRSEIIRATLSNSVESETKFTSIRVSSLPESNVLIFACKYKPLADVAAVNKTVVVPRASLASVVFTRQNDTAFAATVTLTDGRTVINLFGNSPREASFDVLAEFVGVPRCESGEEWFTTLYPSRT